MTPEEIAGKLALLHANGASWVEVLEVHKTLIMKELCDECECCPCEDCGG